MKKILLLLLPLFFVGCEQNNIEQQHYILCRDSKTKEESFSGYSSTAVFAFIVKGYPVLFFKNRKGRPVTIFLSRNDCSVN